MFTTDDLDALLAPHGLSGRDVALGGLRFVRQSRGWSDKIILLEVETFIKIDGHRVASEDGVTALTERRLFQIESVGALHAVEYSTSQ